MVLRCMTILVLLAFAASECPSSNWLQTGDSCYLPLNEFDMTTTDQAALTCTSIDGSAYLAEVHNEQEQQAVRLKLFCRRFSNVARPQKS